MSLGIDPVENLPTEVSCQIFSNLSPSDLGRCCQVNSTWRNVASSDDVWRETAIWKQTLEEEPSAIFVPGNTIKAKIQSIESTTLRSNVEIIKRIQEFVGMIPFGQNARFICYIRENHDSYVLTPLSIEIIGNPENRTVFDFEEETFAVNGLDGLLPNFRLSAPHNEFNWTISKQRKRNRRMTQVQVCQQRSSACSFYGTIRFVDLSNSGVTYTTDMEAAITNIVEEKLAEIMTQHNWRNYARVGITIAGVGLLAYALLKK
jgi:hypothetical protein